MPSKLCRGTRGCSSLPSLHILRGSGCPKRGMQRVMLVCWVQPDPSVPLQCCSLPGNDPLHLCLSVVLRSWCV